MACAVSGPPSAPGMAMARVETYAQAPALRPSAIFGLAILFTALAGVLIWLVITSRSWAIFASSLLEEKRSDWPARSGN